MEEFCGSQFWDLDLTWRTNDPEFTPCFQSTVLVWIPCGFLWVCAAFEIYSALNSRTKNIPWTALNGTKSALTITIIILNGIEFFCVNFMEYKSEVVHPVERYTPLIQLGTFALALFLDHFNRVHGIRTSGSMFIFWGLISLCEIPAFRSAIESPETHPKFQYLWLSILEIFYFPFCVASFLLNCWADAAPLQDPDTYHLSENPNPEKNASFLSRILFFWFEGLARRGYSKPLDFTDLWDLNPEDASKTLNPIFSSYWEQASSKTASDATKTKTAPSVSYQNGTVGTSLGLKRQLSGESGTPPPIPGKVNILPIIFKCFTWTLIAGTIFKFAADLLTFAPPMILNLLIEHVESDDPTWKGYLYAILLFLASFGGTLMMNQYFYKMTIVGLRVRTTVIGALYKKALLISNASREESTVGEIVNLMSVDAQRLTDLCLYLNTMWSAPFQIGLSLYFLWNLLGPSVLAGFGVLILLIPINAVIGSKVHKFQIQQMKNKDLRIKLMNEILSGIKVLKLYAWETSFEGQVLEIRGKEIKVLRQSALLNAGFIFIWTCTPFIVSLVTFATYVLLDNVLDAQTAFVSLALFNVMRMPLNTLSMVIVYIIQAVVSIKRINKFMNSEEIHDDSVGHDDSEEDAIVIENGSFGWKEETPILKGINLRIKEGALVAVVGSVGVGKSTLLSAILGELDHHSGRLNTKGRTAYVAQQAWIQNATLRDNILFGLPFEPGKYDKTVECCALLPDLEILPAGDKTEIGEKGINLSGGQKQRVALARATYNNADVYLLDDPLSAVDAHVGKDLFDRVIGPNGMLRRKTRLLVTHGITFLPEMDQIIVLKDGSISEVGTYRELLAKKGGFSDFLLQHLGTEDDGVDERDILNDLEGVVGSKVELKRRLSKLSESEGDGGGFGTRSFSRQISTLSAKSQENGEARPKLSKVPHFEEESKGGKDKLIELEGMESGAVKLSIFLYYMRALGVLMAVGVSGLLVMNQGFTVAANLWLTAWSNEGSVNGTQDSSTRDFYLGVYAGLGGLQSITMLAASMITGIITLRASGTMHKNMLNRILRAPMSFFDTTPTGRVVNRFAKDVDVTDNSIPMTFQFWINCLLTVVSTFGVICYSTPIFITVVIPITILYFFAQRYYVASLRQLKRLESVSRSPIYSHFGETLTGTVTIRAFGMQDRFIEESEARVDSNQTASYPSLVAGRYISVCLELIGNVVVFFAAVFAIMSRDTLTPGVVGLSVSYALQMTSVLNWLVKMTSDAETQLISVERLKEYSEVVQEREWDTKQGSKPSKQWPEKGEIIFSGYQTRYRDGLDLVLNGVTCAINPGEKVGIVGRTGAGKSSLTLGLFRLIEAAGGSITIDGLDISKLGLQDLRRRLTIIPQDPVIFSGTLRINLDPFSEHRDEAIWHALDHAHLKPFIKGLDQGLEYELTEGGENLSVGQRQLVCLARALLRKTKILVLDEATAAVDLETDDIIQATIRREFKDSTIVTIAHRLNTIMDYTRVMVLDKGRIREFDTPSALVQNRNSLFFGMAKDAGLTFS